MLRIICAILVCLPILSRAAQNFTSSELDTLVSTIALYPDPLLVHVLTASTYGEQIPGANSWAQAHSDLNGEELATEMEKANLPYDPSVQALIPFPTVLGTMAKYRTWSDQLGDAVSTQKEDVMDAIQRLRAKAYDYGQLKSDDQVRVERGQTIVIEPTRREYVYVPVYNPRVVFYVQAGGYPAIRYHHHAWLGTWYGEWGWGSCWFEWDNHFIYVRDYRWYHHRPIPHHPRRYNPPPRPRRLEPAHGFRQPSPSHRAETSKTYTNTSKVSSKSRDDHWDGRRLGESNYDQHPVENRWENHYYDNRNSDNRRKERSANFNTRSSQDDYVQSAPASSSPASSKKRSVSSGNGGFTRVKR